MTINELWHSHDEAQWHSAADRYLKLAKPTVRPLFRELDSLTVDQIRALDARQWFDFLYDKYFPWKYTSANWLLVSRRHLSNFLVTNTLDDLFRFKARLLSLQTEDVATALRTVSAIPGMGVPSASGLLALTYPNAFGTVDRFVVAALKSVHRLDEEQRIQKMNPKSLNLSDATILIQIMRRKAADNNRVFPTNSWTPRKIDKVLWAFGHDVPTETKTDNIHGPVEWETRGVARVPGIHTGAIEMAADFDAPLPDDVWTGKL
jgi:hypothetical protein